MAWTTPKTWASGYVVLAADLNTHLRDNLNVTAPAVMTTAGDIIYASGANTPARLAKSTTSTQYLANTGTSNVPAWNEVALTTGVSGLLPTANGGLAIALSAPGADRILFWDHSATEYAYLTAGSGLTVSGTTMTVAALLAVVDDTSPQLGGNLDMQARLLVGNGGSTGIAISAAGEVTMAAQPAVMAFNSSADSNVTGGGTTYTLDLDSELWDQNGDFVSDTFTAPITGKYKVNLFVNMTGITAAMDRATMFLNPSNRVWGSRQFHPGNVRDGANQLAEQISTTIDMDAADTMTFAVLYNGDGDTADVSGGASSTMSTFVSVELVV